MTSQEDITNKKELLEIYRKTLKLYLKQRAIHGVAFIPPSVAYGIQETRENIRNIKDVLRGWGVPVEDEPNDEEDSDVFSSTIADYPSLHQVPPTPADFIGRDNEVDELISAIKKNDSRIIGLLGMGGIGKTTLALKLVEQISDQYPDAQIYLDLKGVSSAPLFSDEAMSHVIQAFNPQARIPKNHEKCKALYYSILYNKRAVLLMDNAANKEQIEELIPPINCLLIITSRQHFILPGLHTKNLETLSPDNAIRLLLRISSRVGHQAATIAHLCGHLPLALRLAGSALAERVDLKPTDYVDLLKQAKNRLSLIDASLSLSYNLLDKETQILWCMLSTLGRDFDKQDAAKIWDTNIDLAQEVLSKLIRYSLLEWKQIHPAILYFNYRFHDLAHLFAELRLNESDREIARERRPKGITRRIAQMRHARYYALLLHDLNNLYSKGEDSIENILKEFVMEWGQINHAQIGCSQNIENDELAAALCITFAKEGQHLLKLADCVEDQYRWSQNALTAARLLGADFD